MMNTECTVPESNPDDKPNSTNAGISDMTNKLLNIPNTSTIPNTILGSREETRRTKNGTRMSIPTTRAKESKRMVRCNG